MTDDHTYWAWRDGVLAHPDGRAKGGEVCVHCGGIVPPNAHWKHRDRHVCSSRCNGLLARKFNRMLAGAAPRDGSTLPDRPINRRNPRTRPMGSHFGMLDAHFPYDFEGYGPQPGDSVTRFGSTTTYFLANNERLDALVPFQLLDRPVLMCVHQRTGSASLVFANPADLTPTRAWIGSILGLGGGDSQIRYTLDLREAGEDLIGEDGVEYCWRYEDIRHALPDDWTYTWHAPVCVPRNSPDESPMWSPAHRQRSERLTRISATVGRHARRVRIGSGTVERFAALEIFERDDWMCGLCREAIDPSLKWPEPLSASLDHVLPIAAGGEHTRANTQAAHLICNVRKGARTTY